MPVETSTIEQQLAAFREGLVADGYDIVVDGYAAGTARLRIAVGPNACEECLVPKPIMLRMLEESLKGLSDIREIQLAYPAD